MNYNIKGESNKDYLLKCFVHLVTQSCRLFVTPCTLALQAPLAMGFSRQECWSGFPFPSPENLPDPGIEPASPVHCR